MAVLRTTLCAAFMVTVALSKPVSPGDDSSNSSESSEAASSEERAAQVGPSQEPQLVLTETDMPNALEQTDPPSTAALPPSAETDMPNALEQTDPPSTAALPPSAETGMPNALDQTDPPSTAALPPSADAAGPPPAPPHPEDPQTSTDLDALHLMPDDPLHTALGIDISQDMPDSDPAQDSINADTAHVLADTEVSQHSRLTETEQVNGTDGTNQPQVATTATYHGFPRDPTTPTIKPTSPPSSTAPPLPNPTGTALNGVPVSFTMPTTTSEPDPPRGDSI